MELNIPKSNVIPFTHEINVHILTTELITFEILRIDYVKVFGVTLASKLYFFNVLII
jgi:hypothetical protein